LSHAISELLFVAKLQKLVPRNWISWDSIWNKVSKFRLSVSWYHL